MLHEKSQASSPIRTHKSREGIIESVTPARISAEAMQAAIAEVEKLGAGPIWLIDSTTTESFETSCVKLVAAALPLLEKKGLRRIVAILKTPGMRMAARAVAVASRVEIKVVESRLEAAPHLLFK